MLGTSTVLIQYNRILMTEVCSNRVSGERQPWATEPMTIGSPCENSFDCDRHSEGCIAS